LIEKLKSKQHYQATYQEGYQIPENLVQQEDDVQIIH